MERLLFILALAIIVASVIIKVFMSKNNRWTSCIQCGEAINCIPAKICKGCGSDPKIAHIHPDCYWKMYNKAHAVDALKKEVTV